MSAKPADLQGLSARTLAHYESRAQEFWERTRDHDVQQNIDTLLGALPGPGPLRILDLGCGPGRDLKRFAAGGHVAIGLEGSARFAAMARAYSGCEVLEQNFLALDLPAEGFDGIFANASLFHVPLEALPRVLAELRLALRPGGALFSSNPHGNNQAGWQGERYGVWHDLPAWQAQMTAAGFIELGHYYRPSGLPRERQPWLASLWRRPLSGPG
jgi:SAM-dependent methyltransferase